MKYNYIAIEREYGSGGRIIGEQIAKECCMSFYSSDILDLVSEELNIPVEVIKEFEEKATNSFLYSIFLLSNAQSASVDMISNEDRIYITEQKIIKDLAYKYSAVFVVRCAACALKDRNDVLRVFIRSSMDKKRKRCIDKYGISPENAESEIRKFDKSRANYFYANTSKRINSPENYDVILDSGTLGIEGCVQALKGILDMKSDYDL